ncbi:MAG TPA: hypothetical protein VL463_08505 [Kofleriaceae bacterium]|jgi:hypothetical protein|nr:hypothetical protein [Kofleriaceae bacterium]
MDARAGLIIVVAACGATPCERVLARGTLAYDAILDGDVVYGLELETQFALVAHDATTGAVRATIALGGASPDLTAMAISGRTAYVGGRDQQVRAIDLDRANVTTTWPIGADVTALAADGVYVAIGDASGAVCLRRRSDGALLQCLDDGTPVTALAIDHDTLEVDHARRYALPSLAPAGDAPAHTTAPPQVRLGGPIRSVRATPAGTVIAAWVHALDDPSIVLIPHACPR